MTKKKKAAQPTATKAAEQVFTRFDPTAVQPPYLAKLLKDDRATIGHIEDYLAQGCNPNQPDETGKTPIQIAMESHWIEAAMLLKQSGAIPPKFEGNPQGDPNLPLEYKPYRGTVYTNEKDEMESMSAFAYYVEKTARVELIISALVNGADVNLKTKSNLSPLEITQRYRDGREWPWLATQLVKLGAWRDPEKHDPDEIVNQSTGATRLLAIILEGKDYSAVERTLKEGANPNKPDNQGLTPLAAALAVGWPGVEQLLIKHGAKEDVALPDPDQLVGNYRREDKAPLLTYAMRGGNMHSNFFMSLLNAGANPDFAGQSGMTTAYTACVHRNIWHMEQLHKFGADFTKPEKSGMTPVGIACYNNNVNVVKWLDGKIPDSQFTAPMRDSLDTPLHYAVNRPDAAPLVAFLLSKGADPNAANAKGETPLQVAAEKKGNAEALRLMVEASGSVKESINKKDKNGYTALDNAISGSTLDPATVRYLLEQGADIQQMSPGTKGGNPALFEMLTTNWGDDDGKRAKAIREILEMLVEKGDVNFNIRGTRENWNSDFNTSLIYGASQAIYMKLDTVAFMLDHGADVYGTSDKGQSIAHQYISRHNIKGMKMLLDHGFDPLKHWEFNTNWSSGPHATCGTILDEVRMLYLTDKHYKREKDTQPLLDLVEGHLKAKGIDTDAIPYPVMLAETLHDHQAALGKKLEEEKEKKNPKKDRGYAP